MPLFFFHYLVAFSSPSIVHTIIAFSFICKLTSVYILVVFNETWPNQNWMVTISFIQMTCCCMSKSMRTHFFFARVGAAAVAFMTFLSSNS